MKPEDPKPSGLFGLYCAGCSQFVASLQLVAWCRYRCRECALRERGASA